jgi:hypothetical protein
VYASEDLDADAAVPSELPPLATLARANGCEYILFDDDTPATDTLPLFDDRTTESR